VPGDLDFKFALSSIFRYLQIKILESARLKFLHCPVESVFQVFIYGKSTESLLILIGFSKNFLHFLSMKFFIA